VIKKKLNLLTMTHFLFSIQSFNLG